MNRSTNQEKMPLLFLDEQGRSVSFDNIHSMGVVPKNLIPQSKLQLINTLLHRLEIQNEMLQEQRKTKSYLGGLTDADELDELDELITVMVNDVDFSNLSTAAKDKLINSLLRRVKKHQKLIENIKRRNHDERERLRAVELEVQQATQGKPKAAKVTKPLIKDAQVTDSFVELLSGDKKAPETKAQQTSAQVQPTFSQLAENGAKNDPIITPEQKPAANTAAHSDSDKYADLFAEMDAQQEQRRQQAHSLLQKNSTAEQVSGIADLPSIKPQAEPQSAIEQVNTQQSKQDKVTADNNYFAAAPDYLDEEDDEEEDESQYLFELSELYQSEQQQRIGRADTIEVVKMHLGEVANVDYVQPGETYRTQVQGKKLKLIKNARGANCEFFYDSRVFTGQLVKGEASQPLLLPKPNKIEKRQIPEQGVIRLDVGNVTYLLRRIAPITSPQVEVEKSSNKPLYKSLFGSAAFHLVVLLLGSLLVGLQFSRDKQPEPQFVSVDIQDLQPKVVAPKPPEPKVVKPVEKPKPKPPAKPPAKPKAKVAAKPKPTKAKQVAKKVSTAKPASTVKTDVKKSGLLATLGTKKGKTSNSKQALAKVSNLNAVSSLNSQSAKTKVGGLSAKVANSRVSIASGPAIDAQGSMVSGEGRGNIAALSRGDVASGEIRGKVTTDLAKKAKIGGGLSRQAVKKVIDAHMAEVTYCYEKALVGNANLSGKAVFEWKILSNGRVGQVGIQSSTLQSNKLHSCIKGAIKGWQFPQPKGVSSTTVSYPFIFNMVGF